ncbi:alpha/beta hydrolase [Nocardia sp. NEAU-G5]|uniref:Alpha/beta hydrolase n=1 Tax=Nocardia albiluteola TaxID=2842303 RepID=A0ABS6BC18_9NOCA|nr:alpha/beta hydrolase [Nocardia albiluteola]MBU3067836.1 alpha/beta hydrolase [Nocardia albiluteola]
MRFTTFARRVVPLVAVLAAGTLLATSCSSSHEAAPAKPGAFPGFEDGTVDNDGITVHYVKGGQGPAIVLLHGWPEDLQAFQKVAPDLAKDHTVVAVDLPGFGDSGFAKSDNGYQALAVAGDVHAVAQKLNLGRFDIIGHDWGGAIGLAYAAEYRSDVAHLAILEAPPTGDYLNQVQAKPGTFWWDWLANGPKGDLADQLIDGKESTFYGSFYREADGAIGNSESDGLIAAYSKPGRTHAGLEYFRQQDAGEKAVDALIAKDGKITIPVLGIGGEHSMGASVGTLTGHVAEHVTTDVVPNANHWVLEENPAYVLNSVRNFLES